MLIVGSKHLPLPEMGKALLQRLIDGGGRIKVDPSTEEETIRSLVALSAIHFDAHRQMIELRPYVDLVDDHPQLLQLARQYGIPLSDRSSYDDDLWNGHNLALHWQRVVAADQVGNVLQLSEPRPHKDETIAHELAHWIVADPIEREFPEYGCALGVESRASAYKYLNQACWEGVLTQDEQRLREACADFLAVYWCDLFGIPIQKDARPLHKYSTSYVASMPWAPEVGWAAIAWLKQHHLIP